MRQDIPGNTNFLVAYPPAELVDECNTADKSTAESGAFICSAI